MKESIRRGIIGLVVGLITGLAIFFLSRTDVLDGVEHWTADKRFRLRGNRDAKDDLTLVLIDKEYIDARSRKHYAALILRCQGSLVGFDVIPYGSGAAFGEWFRVGSKFANELNRGSISSDLREEFGEYKHLTPYATVRQSRSNRGNSWEIVDTVANEIFTINRDGDELVIIDKKEREFDVLERSTRSGKVYYAFAELEGSNSPDLELLKKRSQTIKWQMIPQDGKLEELAGNEILAPEDKLIRAAEAIGHAHTGRESEKEVLRKIPLLIQIDDHIYPSLALQIACDKLEVKKGEVYLGKYIELLNEKGDCIRRIPINAKGYMYINYVGESEAFNPHLLSEVIDASSEVTLSGIVLVGVEDGDLHKTPIDDKYPGAAIQANIVENILGGKFLDRKGLGTHAVISLILGLLIGGIVATSWTSDDEGSSVLFSIGRGYRRGLGNDRMVTKGLQAAFEGNEILLSQNAMISEQSENHWLIADGDEEYTIREAGSQLNVYAKAGFGIRSIRGFFLILGLSGFYLFAGEVNSV
ncbi:CHASE2 domain-containing protein [Candidatus Poribacteria bacterium]